MYALKNISLSFSIYNVLLYLFIQFGYLNKSPLLGGITLFLKTDFFVMQYIKPFLVWFHKDNKVMFSISNNMI